MQGLTNISEILVGLCYKLSKKHKEIDFYTTKKSLTITGSGIHKML